MSYVVWIKKPTRREVPLEFYFLTVAWSVRPEIHSIWENRNRYEVAESSKDHATPDYRGGVLWRNDDDCILVVKFFFKHSFGKKLFFFLDEKIDLIWKLS